MKRVQENFNQFSWFFVFDLECAKQWYYKMKLYFSHYCNDLCEYFKKSKLNKCNDKCEYLIIVMIWYFLKTLVKTSTNFFFLL